jgi:cytochrome c biogenesis protein CcmG/thiol:disulfide interchange protein DsbE
LKRFLLPLAGFAALLVVLVVGLVHSPDKDIIPSPLIGQSAPTFTLPSLFAGGQPVSSDLLKGHWSLVNVWGSWCATCRDEHSTLLMIKQQGRIPIIGIDWNDDNADAAQWLQQLGNPYAQIGTDPDGHVAVDWGVYGAPESFLVNPQGMVVYKQIGEITPQIWQHEFLARIEAGSTGSATSAAAGRGL